MKVAVKQLPSYHTVPATTLRNPDRHINRTLYHTPQKSQSCPPEDGQKFARNMLSRSWRSIKLLLLHLVGVPYYFTYNDDARSHTNQVYCWCVATCIQIYTALYITRLEMWSKIMLSSKTALSLLSVLSQFVLFNWNFQLHGVQCLHVCRRIATWK
jgi:hypothetical protein